MSRFEIKTERLLLKPLGPEYFSSTNEYAMDLENTKYMMYLPNTNTDETMMFLKNVEAEWSKEEPTFYEFAVIFKKKHVGGVSAYIEDGVAEIGWIINRKYWKNGFAYEASKALVDYFAKNLGITHFMAHCDTENTGSYKLMEKLSMVKTGENNNRKNRSAEKESSEYQYELKL